VCTSPPVPPCADARFGEVTQQETGAISNYNGMVVSFEQHFTRWGSGLFQVNYTYGHALDEVSNGGIGVFTTGGSLFPQDASNLRGSYGAAEYDTRHSLTGNYVWEVPVKEALRGHGPDSLVKGWQLQYRERSSPTLGFPIRRLTSPKPAIWSITISSEQFIPCQWLLWALQDLAGRERSFPRHRCRANRHKS
jgi:hypothetical protein